MRADTDSSAVPNTITLNFEGGANDIPTFSLADLRACAEKGDKEFFRQHFDGKVVLIGTLLDVEDRKITSKRFATAPEGAGRAALRAAGADGRSAVRARLDRRRLHPRHRGEQPDARRRAHRIRPLGHRPCRRSLLAALAAAAALVLGPALAAVAALGHRRRWIAAAVAAFRSALVLPLIEPAVAGRAVRSARRSATASSSPTGTSDCCGRASRSISRRR